MYTPEEVTDSAATASTQAAAEYMGVMISNAVRAAGNGLESAARWAETNPLVVVGVLALVVFAWKVMRGD